MRWAIAMKALIVFGLAIKLHHHFHGPPLDYATLALGAFASWIGVPGPGEPLLIAGGILAAKHKLDLAETLLVAWGAATVGGIGGWLIGRNAGRAVITRRGPFHNARRKVVARGDEIFKRWPVAAILLTPSWISGIHQVRSSVYLPWNAVSAGLWALIIGLGAYFAGPPIVDLVNDLGLVTLIGVVVLVAAGTGVGVGFGRVRRRTRDGT